MAAPVDDAEADECGQRKAEADRKKIDVEGQPVRAVGLRGAGSVEGCHETPEWFCFLFAMPG